MTALLTIAVASVAVLIFVIVGKPRGTLKLAFLFWAGGSTQFSPVPAWLSGLFAASLVLVAAAKCVPSNRKLASFSYTPLAFALAAMLCAPTSLNTSSTLADASGYVVLAVATVAVAKAFEGREVCQAAYMALSVLIVSSYVYEVLSLGESAGDRWKGISGNPNTLGLWIFLWIATSFGLSPRHRWIAFGLGFPLLVMTGSRGSLLSAATAIIAGLLAPDGRQRGPVRRWPFRRTLAILALAISATMVYILLTDRAPSQFVRPPGGSGRQDLNSHAWGVFKEHPIFGIGMRDDGYVMHPHNQLFMMLITSGLVGLAAFGVAVMLLLRTPWRHCAPLSALVWGSLISWGTEAWMLGVGGLPAPIFFLTVSAYATDARSSAPIERGTQGNFRSALTRDQNLA